MAISSNTAPNYQRLLSEYSTFDWSSIGGTVLNRGGDGVTSVEWNGQVFTRRSHSNPEVFTWLYTQEILTEYPAILRRLKVPRNAAGRFINLLGQSGEEVIEPATGEFSPDPKDDPFYHCALGGDADYIITDNVRDFPPVRNRKRPHIITPACAVAKLWP